MRCPRSLRVYFAERMIFSSYMNIFLSSWCLTAGGLLFAFPMIYLRVKDHTEPKDEALYGVSVHWFYFGSELFFSTRRDERG